MYSKIKNFFIDHRISSTNDVFEEAKINLVYNFTFFMSLLAIPFIIQLYINHFWYHLAINIFEVITLTTIFLLFKTNLPLKFIGIVFVLMDSVMSAGSLIFQNGYFEIQAGLWSMLLVIYTFFVLGKKWGLAIVVFIALLYIGCIPFENEKSFLNFNIPQDQILPTASAFIIFPFLLNVYIISVFINTNITAENLMRNQKIKLENQKNEIVASITYAKRIQQAKLPNKSSIYDSLKNSFILFKPKDIVSGDFYFFNKTENLIFIAAADCTGHGVPGAIMSMIGSEKLEDAVIQYRNVSDILKQLNNGIKLSLKQTDSDDSTKDGMDIALCAIDLNNQIVNYAGANRPLWIIRNGSGSIEEIKPNKYAIGGFTVDNQDFESHAIKFQQGDTFYLCTDGYADSFGGKQNKKITTKKFKEILGSIQKMSMQEQALFLEKYVEDWKSNTEQVDDILVIGIRL